MTVSFNIIRLCLLSSDIFLSGIKIKYMIYNIARIFMTLVLWTLAAIRKNRFHTEFDFFLGSQTTLTNLSWLWFSFMVYIVTNSALEMANPGLSYCCMAEMNLWTFILKETTVYLLNCKFSCFTCLHTIFLNLNFVHAMIVC